MRFTTPCGWHPRSMPFPDPLHDTFPPATCTRSRFAAITTSICRQVIYIFRQTYDNLAANCPRSRTMSPPFPHGTHTVPTRRLCAYPADRTIFPCRGKATTRVSRPCSWIFTCGEMEIAASPFICRSVTISMPEKLSQRLPVQVDFTMHPAQIMIYYAA